MSEKLLPCPFCGGEAVIERISGSYGYYPAKLRVACLNSTFDKGSKCGCRGVFFGHGEHGYDKTSVAEAKAIAAWNTRAAMQVDAAPVAWMYSHPNYPLPPSVRTDRHDKYDLAAMARRGWTETPLYAHPPVTDQDPVAKIVAWLRSGGMFAATDFEIATAIEAGAWKQ